ncbi:MAG: integrase [Candidatus Latescibacterota bacterium]|jgi:integrase
MAVIERNGNWWVDTYAKGRRIRRKIGPDRKLAVLVEHDLKVKAAKGAYLGIVEQRQVRFAAFTKDYLKWARANKTMSTYARDEGVVRKLLDPRFGGHFLANLTSKNVEDYKTARTAVVSPRTVNRELDILKSMCARAVEWGLLQTNPAASVKKLRFQRRPPAYLNLAQLQLLLVQCTDQHLRLFVTLAAFTGLRKGELLRLTWDDVDLRRCALTVGQAKNYDYRVIPLNPGVVQALREHPRHISSRLVLARRDGGPYCDLRDGFEAALARAGLPRIRIHDLRHSFASNLVATGASLVHVKELLGHRDISTTMIYAHLAPDQRRAAVDALGRDGQDLDTEGVTRHTKDSGSAVA